MATIFLLGPGEWDPARGGTGPPPMDVRRGMAALFWKRGHDVHHESVARIERGVFTVLEAGGRSRYLTSLARLGIVPIPWSSEAELRERTRLLAAELA